MSYKINKKYKMILDEVKGFCIESSTEAYFVLKQKGFDLTDESIRDEKSYMWGIKNGVVKSITKYNQQDKNLNLKKIYIYENKIVLEKPQEIEKNHQVLNAITEQEKIILTMSNITTEEKKEQTNNVTSIKDIKRKLEEQKNGNKKYEKIIVTPDMIERKERKEEQKINEIEKNHNSVEIKETIKEIKNEVKDEHKFFVEPENKTVNEIKQDFTNKEYKILENGNIEIQAKNFNQEFIKPTFKYGIKKIENDLIYGWVEQKKNKVKKEVTWDLQGKLKSGMKTTYHLKQQPKQWFEYKQNFPAFVIPPMQEISEITVIKTKEDWDEISKFDIVGLQRYRLATKEEVLSVYFKEEKKQIQRKIKKK